MTMKEVICMCLLLATMMSVHGAPGDMASEDVLQAIQQARLKAGLSETPDISSITSPEHNEKKNAASEDVAKVIQEARLKAGLPETPGMPDLSQLDLDMPATTPPEKKKKREPPQKKKSNKKKTAKDWNKIDINAMTDEWEYGDDEDELEHEFERIQRVAASKAEKATKVFKSGNKKKMKEVIDSGAMDTKGGMMFITLTDMQLDGTPWDMKVQSEMCGRWTALLRTASLQANIYNMEPGQVLLQVDKGWMLNDVVRFIMQQPEVVKGYKDGRDYLPSMYADDDDEL